MKINILVLVINCYSAIKTKMQCIPHPSMQTRWREPIGMDTWPLGRVQWIVVWEVWGVRELYEQRWVPESTVEEERTLGVGVKEAKSSVMEHFEGTGEPYVLRGGQGWRHGRVSQPQSKFQNKHILMYFVGLPRWDLLHAWCLIVRLALLQKSRREWWLVTSVPPKKYLLL